MSAADVSALSRLIGGKPDAMLYLAANGDPAASAERPRWDLESNTVALVNILEHCPRRSRRLRVVRRGLRRAARRRVAGDAGVAALPYAISKLASRAVPAVLLRAPRHASSSYVNVRFFGAYGPYEAAAQDHDALAAGDGARASASSSMRGDGENLIDFMYVDDAVDGLLTLRARRGRRADGGLRVGRAGERQRGRAGDGARVGVTCQVRHEGTRARIHRVSIVDRTMRERFGVAPSIAFDDGLARLQRISRRRSRPEEPSMSKPRVVVLGAGPAGMTAAWRLSELGYPGDGVRARRRRRRHGRARSSVGDYLGRLRSAHLPHPRDPTRAGRSSRRSGRSSATIR